MNYVATHFYTKPLTLQDGAGGEKRSNPTGTSPLTHEALSLFLLWNGTDDFFITTTFTIFIFFSLSPSFSTTDFLTI